MLIQNEDYEGLVLRDRCLAAFAAALEDTKPVAVWKNNQVQWGVGKARSVRHLKLLYKQSELVRKALNYNAGMVSDLKLIRGTDYGR